MISVCWMRTLFQDPPGTIGRPMRGSVYLGLDSDDDSGGGEGGTSLPPATSAAAGSWAPVDGIGVLSCLGCLGRGTFRDLGPKRVTAVDIMRLEERVTFGREAEEGPAESGARSADATAREGVANCVDVKGGWASAANCLPELAATAVFCEVSSILGFVRMLPSTSVACLPRRSRTL